MTGELVIPSDEEAEARWRRWQAKGAASDGQRIIRMRWVMAALVATLLVWAIVQVV